MEKFLLPFIDESFQSSPQKPYEILAKHRANAGREASLSLQNSNGRRGWDGSTGSPSFHRSVLLILNVVVNPELVEGWRCAFKKIRTEFLAAAENLRALAAATGQPASDDFKFF